MLVFAHKAQNLAMIVVSLCFLLSSVLETTASGRLEKQTTVGIGVETGTGMLHYQHSCVVFQVFFISDSFFKGLRMVQSSKGLEFEKDGTIYANFPDKLTLDIQATVFRCPLRSGQIISPDYAAGLMSKASFEVSWHDQSGVKPALISSVREEHKAPLRWDYFLELPAKDIPLIETLLIDVRLPRTMQGNEGHITLSSSLVSSSTGTNRDQTSSKKPRK